MQTTGYKYCKYIFDHLMKNKETFPLEAVYRNQLVGIKRESDMMILIATVINNEILCDVRGYARISKYYQVVKDTYSKEEIESIINDCYQIYSGNEEVLKENLRRKAKREAGIVNDTRYEKMKNHFNLFLLENSEFNKCSNPECSHPALSICMDHSIPHRGNEALKFDFLNLAPLCSACNELKADSSDPGWRFALNNDAYILSLSNFIKANLKGNRYHFR